jgi:hypothetical protein
MFFHFSLKSTNKKTGPIPVTTTSADSCPDSCPLKFTIDSKGRKKRGACYANWGPVSWFWSKLSKGLAANILTWKQLLSKIEAIKPQQLWRHDQAGDLPGVNEYLDIKKLQQLVAANGDSKGFTYTHKKKAILEQPGAMAAVLAANKDGFTINISCDNLAEVDQFKALGFPTAITLPEDSGAQVTPAGERVRVCPAELVKGFTCERCGLCQDPNRRNTIGFPAHGVKSKLVELVN